MMTNASRELSIVVKANGKMYKSIKYLTEQYEADAVQEELYNIDKYCRLIQHSLENIVFYLDKGGK